MRHVIAIAKRELQSYFVSPIAYAALTAFVLMSGYFFNSMVVYYIRQASLADRQIETLGRSALQLDVPTVILENFFTNEAGFVLLLILPLLTMGLLTDERRKGTLELLLTSPIRPIELTLGKFFGALSLFLMMLLLTMPYFYFMAQGGQWEPGVVVTGYAGLLLVAAAEIAIGLFVSSLSENMLVSALCTYGVLVALNFIDTSASLARSIWVDFIQFLSFYSHNVEFARGVLALRDITYFGGFLVLALFLTQRSIESIRFREADVKRYLAIPGCLLLVGALIRATVNARWDSLNIWTAAAAVLIIAVTVALNWQEVVEWVRDPRGIFAVTTGISVAIFVGVLVMINIAVWYHPWSIDLTATGRNEVSADTKGILGRLQTPVDMLQFGREANTRVDQILRSFERETVRIRVDFVDSDRQADLARQYGVIRNGTVVVRNGDKFRKVDEPNEQALVTAILQVTTAQDKVLCFVTGHGERGITDTSSVGMANVASTLEASNYKTERISLLEGDVPMQCAAVVIAGPRQPYEQAEIDRLRTYSQHWGRIAVLLEPDPAPSFAEWLRPFGFEPLPGTIVDTSSAGRTVGSGPRSPLAVRYLDHPTTRGFEIATLYDGARPLRVVERAESGKPTALAQTGRESFATTSSEPAPTFVNERDTPGPLTLAAATTVSSGRKSSEETRIAVFGDSDFVSNAYLRRQGNRDFFLRTVAWLLGEQEATIVAVDARENRRLELTERTRAWMYIVNLGLLPLIPLSAGILMFIRSRR